MVLDQHTVQSLFEGDRQRVDGVVEGQRLVVQQVDQPRNRTFLVGAESVGHFVEHHPQTPNVRLYRVDLAPEHLRRHVDGRAQHGLSEVALVGQTLAEAEVPQLDRTVVEEDVGGFEVAVHDVVAGEALESLQQLIEVDLNLGRGQRSLPADQLVESAALAVLIEEVEVVDRLEYLPERNYVGRFDLSQHLHFIESALFKFGVLFEPLHCYDFDCHLFLSAPVDPSEHLAVLALSDLLVESVVLDDLDHPLII